MAQSLNALVPRHKKCLRWSTQCHRQLRDTLFITSGLLCTYYRCPSHPPTPTLAPVPGPLMGLTGEWSVDSGCESYGAPVPNLWGTRRVLGWRVTCRESSASPDWEGTAWVGTPAHHLLADDPAQNCILPCLGILTSASTSSWVKRGC